jgi:hypothetical protein
MKGTPPPKSAHPTTVVTIPGTTWTATGQNALAAAMGEAKSTEGAANLGLTPHGVMVLTARPYHRVSGYRTPAALEPSPRATTG